LAIIKAINSRASIAKAINYITKDEKTDLKLITGKDCMPENAIDEMKAVKTQWRKELGRQYKHYVQSFNPQDNIKPEQAHELGLKWIEQERFKGYQVVIATHIDREHIHNHFIVNSVCFENGKKFSESKKDLQALKDYSNQLSKENGLTVPKKNEDIFTDFHMKKYQTINEKAIKGNMKSYVLEIGKAVNDCKGQAVNKRDFILKMDSKGYQVNWKANSKHVTFQDSENHRVRLANLQKTFKDNNFTKEMLENGFRNNAENHRGGNEFESEIGLGKNVGRTISFADIGKELRENAGLRYTVGDSETEFRSINEQFQEIHERVPGNQGNRTRGKQKMAAEHERSDGKVPDLSRDINQDDLDWLQREIHERDRSFER